MIRKLRTKFVCIVMVIAMLMVGSILGVVIFFTGQNMEMQSISMMRTIAANPFQQGNLNFAPGDEVRLPYFTVQTTGRGEVVSASGGYFDLTDRAYLQEIVNGALLSGVDTGELKDHGLRFLKTVTPVGFTIVFSDTATESATIRNLMYSSLVIFAAAMAVFLGISILLSHWAIKPVERAWDQQRQFVADASHELKTPLSVIMANAELLQNEDPPARQDFAQNILSMSYQMRSLVENMLEMARVDNGAVKMNMERLEFDQLVRDAVLSFQLLYEEKGLGLHSDIAQGITLQGSEQHLYQLLDVLLDNAMKYSAPGGHVWVTLKHSGRVCTLSVASPGEEISREDLTNIFKRFYRADKARAMNGSYGLGLSIAQGVVQAHKGRIWAVSEKGWNTFHVQLPVNNN